MSNRKKNQAKRLRREQEKKSLKHVDPTILSPSDEITLAVNPTQQIATETVTTSHFSLFQSPREQKPLPEQRNLAHRFVGNVIEQAVKELAIEANETEKRQQISTDWARENVRIAMEELDEKQTKNDTLTTEAKAADVASNTQPPQKVPPLSAEAKHQAMVEATAARHRMFEARRAQQEAKQAEQSIFGSVLSTLGFGGK